MLMLDLWLQVETPGVTHFGAYHRPPDGHFFILNEQACQVLVPGIFAQCQIQGARTSHGKVCFSFSSPLSSLSWSSSSPSSSLSWSSSSLSWSSSSTIRSAILGEQRNNYFCDVACGRGEMVSPFTDLCMMFIVRTIYVLAQQHLWPRIDGESQYYRLVQRHIARVLLQNIWYYCDK